MLAYIMPLQGGSGGEVTPPIYYPGGPVDPGYGHPGWIHGRPSLPIALPPEMWPKPPLPPGEVTPPIVIPGGGIIMPPIALPKPPGTVTPPIYFPPGIWPNPPGGGLPGIPTGKAFVAVYTGRSGWHAAIVDVPEPPPTAGPK